MEARKWKRREREPELRVSKVLAPSEVGSEPRQLRTWQVRGRRGEAADPQVDNSYVTHSGKKYSGERCPGKLLPSGEKDRLKGVGIKTWKRLDLDRSPGRAKSGETGVEVWASPIRGGEMRDCEGPTDPWRTGKPCGLQPSPRRHWAGRVHGGGPARQVRRLCALPHASFIRYRPSWIPPG